MTMAFGVCLAIEKYNFWPSEIQFPVPAFLLHERVFHSIAFSNKH